MYALNKKKKSDDGAGKTTTKKKSDAANALTKSSKAPEKPLPPPPAKPQGILRNSTHHSKLSSVTELVAKSALPGKQKKNSHYIAASPCSSTASSHKTIDFTGTVGGYCATKDGKREITKNAIPTGSNHSVSFEEGGAIEVVGLSDGDVNIDVVDDDVDSFASDQVEEVPINFDDKDERKIKKTSLNDRTAKQPRPGLKRLTSQGSFMGFSTHSYLTNRSQMQINVKEGFDDDPKWKAFLRYMRLLPPHKAETDLKRKIRTFTWVAMLLDFIAAMVAVTTYKGSTTCAST